MRLGFHSLHGFCRECPLALHRLSRVSQPQFPPPRCRVAPPHCALRPRPSKAPTRPAPCPDGAFSALRARGLVNSPRGAFFAAAPPLMRRVGGVFSANDAAPRAVGGPAPSSAPPSRSPPPRATPAAAAPPRRARPRHADR